jgi:hypothetical protein
MTDEEKKLKDKMLKQARERKEKALRDGTLITKR